MPQIADRKSMARYICVDKGATHPALQREELPKHMAIYTEQNFAVIHRQSRKKNCIRLF